MPQEDIPQFPPDYDPRNDPEQPRIRRIRTAGITEPTPWRRGGMSGSVIREIPLDWPLLPEELGWNGPHPECEVCTDAGERAYVSAARGELANPAHEVCASCGIQLGPRRVRERRNAHLCTRHHSIAALCRSCVYRSSNCSCGRTTVGADYCANPTCAYRSDDGCTCAACRVDRARALVPLPPATVAEAQTELDGFTPFNEDDDEYSDDDDDGDDEHVEIGDDAREYVNQYSFKPRPDFHGENRYGLFLGMELEYETPFRRRRQAAKVASEDIGDVAYLKYDGSLSNGLELVTHPMSYDYAIKSFPWNTLSDMEALGCSAARSAGIHIHLSRAGFSGANHTYRWMKFIHRNAAIVQRVAGRQSDEWASFDNGERHNVKMYAKGHGEESTYAQRYSAINVQNEATLELRIFASTLDPERAKAYLGFAEASVEYTRTLNAHRIVKNDGWAWPEFARWVKANRKTYAPLYNYLKDLECAY